jgi:tRNA (adenine57-N1/adenine58-N1)-methyltransferase
MTRQFAPGDQVLLIDAKKRRYLVTLEPGGEFHTHAGVVAHDDLIGRGEGSSFRSSRGATMLAIRPTLAEFVLKMPRGAQVIYPKDLGPLLMLADIYPGARVLESGVGSGALSMTLVRAGAVVSGYELREDFANRATKNVATFLGPEALARALHRGGILVAYTPQITQAVQLREELAGQGFGMVDTVEVLNRGWHIEGQSVRPDHRMVAHTGFLTHARLLS